MVPLLIPSTGFLRFVEVAGQPEFRGGKLLYSKLIGTYLNLESSQYAAKVFVYSLDEVTISEKTIVLLVGTIPSLPYASPPNPPLR